MAKSIAVHGADGKFQYYTPRAEAVGMVKDNLASWMPGSPAIEIKLGSITDPNYRGMSSKPKANLIHRYAEDRMAGRNTATVTAVNAWEWQPICNVMVKGEGKRIVPPAYGGQNDDLRKFGLDALPVSEKDHDAIEAARNLGWEATLNRTRRQPNGSVY